MSRLPFMIAIAAAVIALGFFAFVTDAPAYGGSAPETCANCHVMDSQYENWYTGTDACSAVHKRYVTAANRNILRDTEVKTSSSQQKNGKALFKWTALF